jgi:hypothetical protein
MKSLTLLTLHGMGKHRPDYAVPLTTALQARLGTAWGRVHVAEVHYAPLLQGPQQDLWEASVRAAPLKSRGLRRFVLHSLGDPVSLEHAHNRSTVYEATQRLIQDQLRGALAAVGGDPQHPVVVVAQSLGCQVLSNYIWDAQHRKGIFADAPADPSPQERFLALGSLRTIVTTGCNIPLFVSGIADRRCFDRPEGLRWVNCFDLGDVLGWPMAPLGESYGWIEDKVIRSGNSRLLRMVRSHTAYWKDGDLHDEVAGAIRGLLA